MALEAEQYHFVDAATSSANGPYTLDQFKDLWLQGLVKKDTLVFGAPDQTEWLPLQSIPALFDAVAPASSPAPPPLPSRSSKPREPAATSSAPAPAPRGTAGGAPDLMAAIRGAGGSGKARLRKTKTVVKQSQPSGTVRSGLSTSSGGKAGVTSPRSDRKGSVGARPQPAGGMLGELAAKLERRRRKVSQQEASTAPADSPEPAPAPAVPPRGGSAPEPAPAPAVPPRGGSAPEPAPAPAVPPRGGSAPEPAPAPAVPPRGGSAPEPAPAPAVPPRGGSAPEPAPAPAVPPRSGRRRTGSQDDLSVGMRSTAFTNAASKVAEQPGGGGARGLVRVKAGTPTPVPGSTATGRSKFKRGSVMGTSSTRGGGKGLRKKSVAAQLSVAPTDSVAPFGLDDDEMGGEAPSNGVPAPPPRHSPDDAWQVKRTADGKVYYFNHVSGELTWEKPQCLQTAAERATSSAEWTWVPHAHKAWVPAQITARSGDGSVTVATRDGLRSQVAAGEAPLWHLHLPSLDSIGEVTDLVQLRQLNEATIITCLAERFNNDEIYTWVGASKSVLVSLNPFKLLPLYTPKVIAEHAKPPPNKELPPHVFDIASGCWRSLCATGKSQSVLISGESGAGKTEAAKQCLTFLAETVGSVGRVEQKLLQSNPVLEAFGNAKTVRNNNSSRFGKWVEYYVDNNMGGRIIGARIENYLLEKSRVALQAAGERGYHIFYQLTASQYGADLGLDVATQYRSLIGGSSAGGIGGPEHDPTVPGIDDATEFEDTVASFLGLGIDHDEEVLPLMHLLAGLLHLGNVTFQAAGEGSVVDPASTSAACSAAASLSVAEEALAAALTHRSIEVGAKRTRIPLNPAAARDAADALAKNLYGRMFDWLVRRINQAVAVQPSEVGVGSGAGSAQAAAGSRVDLPFIGVLDIFGFEIFKVNSFEQLCINFANERLQQLFNQHTFKEEIAVYEAEGIPVPPVRFIDNKPVLDLIQQTAKAPRKGGILVLLDDEIRLPKTSDETFVNKIMTAHGTHPALSLDTRSSFGSGLGFTITHYAGKVDYDAQDFLVKNKDVLWTELTDLMLTSGNPLVPSGMFQSEAAAKASGSRRTSSKYSMGGQFRSQLTALVRVLKGTEPRYIRCVKTTPHKRPNDLHPALCIEQLRYSGVFEAVQIRKTGYPFRMSHQQFVARYAYVNDETLAAVRAARARGGVTDFPSLVRQILTLCQQDMSRVQIGHTMVLYRAEQHGLLELMRNLALEPIALLCQAGIRGALARRFVSRWREITPVLRDALATGNDLDAISAAVQHAYSRLPATLIALMPCEPPILVAARTLRDKLRQCVQLEQELATLLGASEAEKATQQFAYDLAAAVKVVEGVRDVPHTLRLDQLAAEAKDFLATVAGRLVDPEAREALYLLDKPAMQRASAKAAEYAYTSADILQIREVLALSEEELTKLQLKRAMELGDGVRVINREVKLQDIYLAANARFFRPDTYPRLRDAEEYGGSTFLTSFIKKRREALTATMLVHTVDPIPTSLTQLEGDDVVAAVRMHKSVLMWCGDRKASTDVATVASEVVGEAGRSAVLAHELFLQLMKQVQGNPNPHSVDSAWTLMYFLLRCVGAAPDVEGHVLTFIRANADDWAQPLVSTLHNSKYAPGERHPLPSPGQIDGLVEEFGRGIPRSRFSLAEDAIQVGHGAAADPSATMPRTATMANAERFPLSALPADMSVQESPHPLHGGAAPAGGRPMSAKYASPAAEQPPPVPQRGEAPPLPPRQNPIAVAAYPFTKSAEDAEDTLNLEAGEEAEVLDTSDPDWWQVRLLASGLVGFVPASFLQVQTG